MVIEAQDTLINIMEDNPNLIKKPNVLFGVQREPIDAFHDGVKGILTDKSLNHLTSKHADTLGIEDPLSLNLNQRTKAYKQTRTRINKVNKKKFSDTVKKILEDPNTEVFPGISIRGITDHGYYNKDYGESDFFVGIPNEGDFTGQIKKGFKLLNLIIIRSYIFIV